MKNISDYRIEDFVQDLDFQDWVFSNTPDSNTVWAAQLAQYPEQKANMDLAKSIVLGLKIKEIPLLESDIEQGIDRILRLSRREEPTVVSFYNRPWFRIAASVVLLLTVGFWWMNQGVLGEKTGENTVYTEGSSNYENAPKSITLPDGSTVVLQKNSEIRYEKDFAGQTRAVQFKGEGLFDVVKNPDKPFVVHSGDVITRVLGTSFIIKAFDNDNRITVDVIRGKVSVATEKKQTQTATPKEVFLEPNQKAVFSKLEEKLEQTLIDKPAIITSKDTFKELVFEEAPIGEIFEKLEKVYGVAIVYDKNTLKNCALTTTLSDETLFEKLDVICKGIGATYRIEGIQVLIEGKNCR